MAAAYYANLIVLTGLAFGLRKSMQTGEEPCITAAGPIEVGTGTLRDVVTVAGAARNLSAPRWKNRVRHPGKTLVFGMLDRDQRKVRASVVTDVKRDTLRAAIPNHVEHGSKVYSDSAIPYTALSEKYAHEIVNHAVAYVSGRVHTNGLENFRSLLKRSLRGTYVAVEPFHLDRYVDEEIFRHNHRATKESPMKDADRFSLALTQIVGKRLTYVN